MWHYQPSLPSHALCGGGPHEDFPLRTHLTGYIQKLYTETQSSLDFTSPHRQAYKLTIVCFLNPGRRQILDQALRTHHTEYRRRQEHHSGLASLCSKGRRAVAAAGRHQSRGPMFGMLVSHCPQRLLFVWRKTLHHL